MIDIESMRAEMTGDAFEIVQSVIGRAQAETKGVKRLDEVVEEEVKSGNSVSKNDRILRRHQSASLKLQERKGTSTTSHVSLAPSTVVIRHLMRNHMTTRAIK